MDGIRVVALGGLRAQLEDAIGSHHELFELFSEALTSKDADQLETAFKSLEAYPEPIRDAVNGAIITWLFAGPDGAGLDHLELPSKAMH